MRGKNILGWTCWDEILCPYTVVQRFPRSGSPLREVPLYPALTHRYDNNVSREKNLVWFKITVIHSL